MYREDLIFFLQAALLFSTLLLAFCFLFSRMLGRYFKTVSFSLLLSIIVCNVGLGLFWMTLLWLSATTLLYYPQLSGLRPLLPSGKEKETRATGRERTPSEE